MYKDWNKRNLLLCKNYLIETYKPKTVNLRIQAMNKYFGVYQKRQIKTQISENSAKNLSGKCYQ
jgi:hypothetical protein